MSYNPTNIALHGWLILDKPRDLGSTPALAVVRRLLGELAGCKLKAGHAGTLDPFAEGVLPIAFGEATKTIAFAQDRSKSYRFTVQWGIATDTEDCTGKAIAVSAIRPGREAILAALPCFAGTIMQRPPIYSALHVNGQRAYDLARAGEIPELAPREIHIESLKLLDIVDADHAVFEVTCGKGTYVRSLARDLAEALGTKGHVTRLVREKVGQFRRESAFSLEKLRELLHKGGLEKALLPLDVALDDIPGIDCDSEAALRLRQGRTIAGPPDRPEMMEEGCMILARQREDRLPIAILERRGDELQPVRVFNLL